MPWFLALALGVLGCGGDGPSEDPNPSSAGQAAPGSRSVELDDGAGWAERLSEPTVPDLLAALAQPHAVVREAMGPHRLQIVTDVALSGDAAAARHPLDTPVVEDHAIHDELELRWAPVQSEGSEPELRLSLSQSNDHDRGRDVVVIGPTLYVRHAHRPWFHHLQEGPSSGLRSDELVEQWLDDAQRSVHDAIQLAAPRLALRADPVEGAGLSGGSAVEIVLAPADQVDPSLVAAGPTQGWRADAEIEAVEGTVRLDAGSGAWLSATVDVRYRLPAADGRVMSGHLHVQAQAAPGSVDVVRAPEGSRPLPSRLRYDDEQQRLLDGLAAP
ncbi:hypothetical protein [Paraliomyxa miuraensis]|uniref:hypothetical protein n=1 Tax=Paraliomyxa miuraensis TaxID=376150 RepID=UPI002258FB49|nr:hypothetical protein [Paraliomyxa miuraensis]MCX4243220.1 hypothetical protein [Paraliomyxa miuraensis]